MKWIDRIMHIFRRPSTPHIPPLVPCTLHPDRECMVQEQLQALAEEKEQRDRARRIEALAELQAQHLREGEQG